MLSEGELKKFVIEKVKKRTKIELLLMRCENRKGIKGKVGNLLKVVGIWS